MNYRKLEISVKDGAASHELSENTSSGLFKLKESTSFDMLLCQSFRYPKEFDRGKFRTWFRQSSVTSRSCTEDILISIQAADSVAGELLVRNAGVLFFAKDVRRFFPHAYITCIRAKGIDKVTIIDRKDFAQGIVRDIEEGLRFIERNTRTVYRIEGLRREDVPEYPANALREAITNAVMHRDYFETGANVFVEIYDDRIEISNPGGLPKGLTRKYLGTRSVRRNPIIADLLHRIHFIEKAGTGISRMRAETKKHKCPLPKFTVNGFFLATFFPTTNETHTTTPHDEQKPYPARRATFDEPTLDQAIPPSDIDLSDTHEIRSEEITPHVTPKLPHKSPLKSSNCYKQHKIL